jgi:hypothetical protein
MLLSLSLLSLSSELQGMARMFSVVRKICFTYMHRKSAKKASKNVEGIKDTY